MSWVKKAETMYGMWISPAGVATKFEYPDYYHAEAIEDGLLPLTPAEVADIMRSKRPEDELVSRGWGRVIVDKMSDEVELETSGESNVESFLEKIPMIPKRLLVDAGPNDYALLLAEDEDLVSAWRNRNRARVFAKIRRNPWPKRFVRPHRRMPHPVGHLSPAHRPHPVSR
jgi:hypothetical protein